MTRIDFEAFWHYYRRMPHQMAAIKTLEESLPVELLTQEAEWVQTYRAAGKQPEKAPITNPIDAPYFSQLDSETEHAFRMCFSSSCAMLLETLLPGTLNGPNGDDVYLGRVLRFGDTTDPAAQLKALASFGVIASFTQRATFQMIEDQIEQGIPVPLGFLHGGPSSAPSGGGHWLCCVGYTENTLIVMDPFGEMSVALGGYLNGDGRMIHYSRANFGPRWEVEGPGSGWAIIANL